ncbi:MAG: dihydroorotate dehydrogenase electron transfer subunit [Deltaproteobacteria bacterium]|nr:dihydroorotate dehydrogenase electron transfer subunit [Deltaproteobacteria bacterium]MBW2112621.1 dihydroorotate dehydrogenase electron transfer subunit [Deltaproteobacteria bacterium]MBW2353534.1 dihydroorotate dehydrogenase electron transfer subunit [Deltaproteobacteria bacterium]
MIEQDAELVFNRRIATSTFLMGLRSTGIAAEARPGQFVMLRVGQGMDPLLRRPFSICGTREHDLVLILYRVVGRGTGIMSRLGRGERLSVLGPLGRGFDMPGDRARSVLVAGGMGIAPLIFLARSAKGKALTLLAGFGTSGEIPPLGELGLGGIDLHISTDDGSAGKKGLVTALLRDLLLELESDRLEIFACGPLPMLKEVAAMSLKEDIPCQVSLEARMACGLGACQGCATRGASDRAGTYVHVCVDGPVFAAGALDWEAS